jgi:hypothetical protein
VTELPVPPRGKVTVWQYLVYSVRGGYTSTRGYFYSRERCEQKLGPVFKVLRKLEFTHKEIDGKDLEKWEQNKNE